MKIAIHKDGKYGFISYDKDHKEVMITHPDRNVVARVHKYLTSARPITIDPMDIPNAVGNRTTILAKPTDSLEYMNMSLCEMNAHTGIHVDWGNKDNWEDSASQFGGNINGSGKTVLKSVFGDDSFYIE